MVSNFRAELGVELNYDRESIEWLDGYINRVSPQLTKESVPGVVTALGAYLGETIIATYGGTWDYNQQLDQWGVRFEEGTTAFPFSKVYKQLENGESESILSLFTALPVIRERSKQRAE